jgi:hypothetical protein
MSELSLASGGSSSSSSSGGDDDGDSSSSSSLTTTLTVEAAAAEVIAAQQAQAVAEEKAIMMAQQQQGGGGAAGGGAAGAAAAAGGSPWKVKLYTLNAEGQWDDLGTGHIAVVNGEFLRLTAENDGGTLLLDKDIRGHVASVKGGSGSSNGESSSSSEHGAQASSGAGEVYSRQGDNIITWCEPQRGGVDLALSFQDNAGCLDVWGQIMAQQRLRKAVHFHPADGAR